MFFALPLQLNAQHDLTLYNFSPVPQRIYENPAFIPEQKVYVGLPLLSGIRSSFANPFSYHRVLSRTEDDSLNFEADAMIKSFLKNPRIRLNETIDILSVGTQIAQGKFFLNFGVRQRFTAETYIPAELLDLVIYGNTAPQLFGKVVNISPSVNATLFDEYSVSFSGRAMENKLTFGVNVKYLSGRINVSSKKTKMELYTDSKDYKMFLRSDLEINSSGMDQIDKYFSQPVTNLVFPKNHGFGIDLGATYLINEKIRVNAAVLDLGFIKWKTNTLKWISHNPGSEVQYSGMNLHDFVKAFDDPGGFGKEVLDSVSNLVKIDSVYGGKYITYLPTRFNIGGVYTLDPHNCLSIVYDGISCAHHLSSAFGLSYTYTLKNFLGLTASYNIFNRQYWNFGGGINLKAGPIQLFIISDNVPGLIIWKSTNNASIYFGINISIYQKS
ncbi:MAG: DUF5723 family protein [Bacteroidota bacterium]|nr:DUF5723 family protein [Bacteroidota bacterium]